MDTEKTVVTKSTLFCPLCGHKCCGEHSLKHHLIACPLRTEETKELLTRVFPK